MRSKSWRREFAVIILNTRNCYNKDAAWSGQDMKLEFGKVLWRGEFVVIILNTKNYYNKDAAWKCGLEGIDGKETMAKYKV